MSAIPTPTRRGFVMTTGQIRFFTLWRREINRFMKIKKQTIGASERTSKGIVVPTSITSPPSACLRRSSGVAKATRLPSEIRATSSQYSDSPTYCVVTITVTPDLRSRSSSCQTLVRNSGSMPAVGSSRISRLG